jgi:hypothetical protein
MPIEREIHDAKRLLRTWRGGVSVFRAEGLGRSVVILEGPRPVAAAEALRALLNGFKTVLSSDKAPMANVVCFLKGHTYTVLLFPRAKHRPRAFFLKGDERLAISPAAVEMGGVLVTPLERDFERLDCTTVERIYDEVSLPSQLADRAVDAMG